MSIRFRLLTEADVKSVLTMDDLIDAMAVALERFSTGRVTQPVRTVVAVAADEAFFALMPAFVRADSAEAGALGAKLVTVFGANAARGLPSHLASILLLDPETGALRALLDGRFITEARTAAVSAVASRLLARKTAGSLAIIGSGVQARSHLEALSRVHQLRQVSVWSPNKRHRDQFVAEMTHATPGGQTPGQTPAGGKIGKTDTSEHRFVADGAQATDRGQTRGLTPGLTPIRTAEHPGDAVVGADLIVLATSSPTPVLENGWVKPGAHIISVGACRPTQREMDPELVTRARLFVDSRAAALVESGDVVLGIQDGRFSAEHIVAEIGDLVAGAVGRRTDTEVTIFKSLGLAVEDVMSADLAYRRAVERGIGLELTL